MPRTLEPPCAVVASVDINSGNNLISRYDVDSVGNGVLVAPVPNLLTSFRLGVWSAWDFGPAGLGVDYAPSGALDGQPDGPVVCALDLRAPCARGPYGLNPDTLNAGVGQTPYEFFGNPGVQLNNGPRIVADGGGNTFFRDIDVHPANGDFLVRASNTVIYNQRNPNGTTTRIDLAPADNATTKIGTIADFVPGQNVQFMSGYSDASVGEIFVWNSRTGSGQAKPSPMWSSSTRPAARIRTRRVKPFPPAFSTPMAPPPASPAASATTTSRGMRPPRFCSSSMLAAAPSTCSATNAPVHVASTVRASSEPLRLHRGRGGTSGADGSTCTVNPCAQPAAACSGRDLPEP